MVGVSLYPARCGAGPVQPSRMAPPCLGWRAQPGTVGWLQGTGAKRRTLARGNRRWLASCMMGILGRPGCFGEAHCVQGSTGSGWGERRGVGGTDVRRAEDGAAAAAAPAAPPSPPRAQAPRCPPAQRHLLTLLRRGAGRVRRVSRERGGHNSTMCSSPRSPRAAGRPQQLAGARCAVEGCEAGLERGMRLDCFIWLERLSGQATAPSQQLDPWTALSLAHRRLGIALGRGPGGPRTEDDESVGSFSSN